MNATQVRSVYRRGAEHPVQIRRYTDPDAVQLLLTEDIGSSVVVTEDANNYLATSSNEAMLTEAVAPAYILTEDDNHYLELSFPAYQDYPTLAKITGLLTDSLLTEGVSQYPMRAIVLTDALLDANFPMPITTNDKLVWQGKEWAIEVPDGATKYAGAALVAYQLMLKG